MILVTGASGALGGLILERLSSVPGLDVAAGTRDAERWAGTVPVRRVDFDQPDTLADGFAGTEVLVLVSAGYAEDDVVIARHGAAIDAASKAGVRHVVYTSLAGSGDHLTIALAHRWTESALAAAPFESTILRNGLYAEVPVGLAMLAASTTSAGVFSAPWGDGRVPVVAREDLADVAARVAAEAHADLAGGRHAGRTYELDGVTALGGADVAAALTEALGTPVAYRPTALGDTWATLAGRGLPPYQIAHAVSLHSNIKAGLLTTRHSDLTTLLETDPRPVLDRIVATAGNL